MIEVRVQQPGKLESLALAELGAWVAAIADRLTSPISELAKKDAARAETALSRHIETIRHYMDDKIPSVLYDRFASAVICALTRLLRKTEPPKKQPLKLLSYLKTRSLCRPVSGTNAARRMIEILFTKNLTFLSLVVFQWEMFGASLCIHSHMLTNLAHFKLDFPFYRNYKRTDLETDIIRFLKTMHNLQYLSLGHNTSRVLKCIANSCKSIKELHLAVVAEKDIETILLFCDNIEHFSTDNGIVLRRVLEMCYARNGGKPFKLKSYSGYGDTLEQLQAVVQMCPLIRYIKLNKGDRAHGSNLPALTDLGDICELKLIGYEFYDDQMGEILQAVGRKIECLHLKLGDQIDFNALKHVSQACPNLKTLSIEVCRDTKHLPFTEKLEILPFRNLNKLILNAISPGDRGCVRRTSRSDYTNSVFDENTFLFLLSNCLNIEYIKIGRSVGITEDMMLKLLDINPLNCLKELVVWIPLSTCIMDRILENSQANVIEMCNRLIGTWVNLSENHSTWSIMN